MATLLCSACSLPCRAVSTICRTVCNVTGNLCSGPFCLYSSTTLAFNVPPIVAGTMVLVSNHRINGGCGDGYLWLLVNTCLCVCNIGAAWYIATRSSPNPDDPGLLRQVSSSSASPTSTSTTRIGRSMHLLCYDPVIAVYILLLVFFFCWLSVGAHWKISGRMHVGEGGCSESNNIDGAVDTSIGCGYSFFVVGSIALCCSLCCAVGYGVDDGHELDTTNNTSTSQEEHLLPEQNPAYAPPSAPPLSLMRQLNTDMENLIPVAMPDDTTTTNHEEHGCQEQNNSCGSPLMGHLCTDDEENRIPIATPVTNKTA